MLVDSVEESLEIYFAALSILIEIYLDVSARNHLAVERVRIPFAGVVEIQFFRNFRYRCIQQHVLTVQNNDRIDDVLKIPYLVGGNEDDRVFSSVSGDSFPELCL